MIAVCFYGAPVVAFLMMWNLIDALDRDTPKEKKAGHAWAACLLFALLTFLFMTMNAY